jgi:hypothetical protein
MGVSVYRVLLRENCCIYFLAGFKEIFGEGTLFTLVHGSAA